MIENLLNVFFEKYHQKKGIKFLNKAKYKNAHHSFEKALLIKDSTVNYFYFSVSLIALNRHIEAVGYLEKIIDKHTDDILISSTLVECYLVIREWEKAEQLIDYLFSKFQDNSFIQKMHILTHDVILREKYAAAKESFFKALDHIEKKEFELAYLSIKNAIELDESNAAYYYLAGTVLVRWKKKKEEIVVYFEKAVLLAPQNEGYKKHLQYVKTRYKG